MRKSETWTERPKTSSLTSPEIDLAISYSHLALCIDWSPQGYISRVVKSSASSMILSVYASFEWLNIS